MTVGQLEVQGPVTLLIFVGIISNSIFRHYLLLPTCISPVASSLRLLLLLLVQNNLLFLSFVLLSIIITN